MILAVPARERRPRRSGLRVAVSIFSLLFLIFSGGNIFAGGAPAPADSAENTSGAESTAPAAVTSIERRADGRLTEEFLVVPLAVSGDATGFAESLAIDIAIKLSQQGFSVTRAASLAAVVPQSTLIEDLVAGTSSERELAFNLAELAGRRFLALAFVTIENSRLLWRASLYDAATRTLLSSAGGVSFAGLSVLPLLAESADLVASQAVAATREYSMEGLIEYRLAVRGGQGGVTVYLGSGTEGRVLGEVTEGEATLGYLPYAIDSNAILTIDKEGYWPRTFEVPLPATEPGPVMLPELMPKSDGAYYFAARYPGPLGVTAGLRWNLVPDQVFFKAENSLWFATSLLPGSRAIIHNETRAAFGAYILLPRDSVFRISASLGVSAIQTIIPYEGVTQNYSLDLLLDPVAVSVELHLQHLAPFIEIRLPYSFGLEPGLLPLGWAKAGDFPFLVTVGVMEKW